MWKGLALYDADGDLKKRWFVYYHFQHPSKKDALGRPAFERFKVYENINEAKTLRERRKIAGAYLDGMRQLLEAGFNPYDEFRKYERTEDKNVINCIDRYLENIKGNIADKTYLKYQWELRLFRNYLIEVHQHMLDIGEIKTSIISDFLSKEKAARKWSGKTYNHYRLDISTFFQYYISNYDEYLTINPVAKIKRAKVDRPGNSALTDEQFAELKRLMQADGEEMLMYYCSFVYYAALRSASEANLVKRSDFNFSNMKLKVNAGNAKSRRTQYIPIYPEFYDLLVKMGVPGLDQDQYIFAINRDAALEMRPNGERSFTRVKIGGDTPIGAKFFQLRFQRYKDMVGLSARDGIYCYKHTRGVHLAQDGEDLYKIMELFRHRDLATTMIYLRDLGANVGEKEYKKGRVF